jgi:hypothetical protein
MQQMYREQELDGKRPARGSDHEAAMRSDVEDLTARRRWNGPDAATDELLQLMHKAIVAVGDKHRGTVQQRTEREPAASGLAPQNNRQEGDFSLMKARLALNGDTRAGLLDAMLRVKHGRYTLGNNSLSAAVRAGLMEVARNVVAEWPTRRQKHETVLAAAERKEAAAEARQLAREARQRKRASAVGHGGGESKEEKRQQSSDEEAESDNEAIAAAAAVRVVGDDEESSSDGDGEVSSSGDDADGARTAAMVMSATAVRNNRSGRNVRRRSL